MATTYQQGSPPITLHLRRNARSRRITLRISRRDGTVTLTLPPHVPDAEALAFARSKDGWIRKHLDTVPQPVAIAYGEALPLRGKPVTLQQGHGRRVQLEGDRLLVPATPERLAAKLRGWLREEARRDLTAACDFYADRLGRPFARIELRDTVSRWGSCSAQGRLMFSWRLVMAPRDVLAYVAAHEVAHLAEMNHSDAFWRTVERIHGPYADQRRWLRAEGTLLHAIPL